MTKRIFSILAFYGVFFSTFLISPTAAAAQKKSQTKQAQKLSAEADRSLRQKDFKTAISKYSEAISIVPSLAQAHFGKGSAHIELNETEPAIREMDAALAGGYKPLDVYKVRWRLYFERKNYDAALQDAEKAAQIDSSDAALYRAIGEIQLARNAFQAALDNFQKFAIAAPKNADIDYFIAAAYAGLKNTEKQRAAAESAVAKNTKYLAESYFLIAEAERANKNDGRAAEFYGKAIAAEADVNVAAYRNLAEIYRRQNRFREAAETTRSGLLKFAADGNLYVDLARFYILAERNAEAVAAAEKAAELLPENTQAQSNLCRVYYETKQLQAALKACGAALKLNPSDGASTVYSGFVNLSLGRENEAKEIFKRAAEQMTEYTRANPDYFDGFYMLGNALYYAEQPQKAIQAYLKTLELNPAFTRARFNLGLAYFVSGNLPAARAQYNALLKTNKDLADKLKATIEKR